MLYPLLFTPVLKERVWGGRRLGELFDRELPQGKIGESWEVACHKNGNSIVKNGSHRGWTLKELIYRFGRDLLGADLEDRHIEKFPLLIKMLDASDVLSVQVHPGDEYARIHEGGESGKTEMWYIIDAKPGAYLYFGIKSGLDAQSFKKIIQEGDLEPYLGRLEVKNGDVLYIPSGMVHAIGPGIVLCEIQQNSDTTYRVYDWNRLGDDGKPRDLHIEKALEVIDFECRFPKDRVKGLKVQEEGGLRTYFVGSPYFAMEKLVIDGEIREKANGSKFYILTVIEGEGRINFSQGSESFVAGDSILIPANLGDYSIEGRCTVLRSYIPYREKDIIKPLMEKGFSRDDLKGIAGLFD